MKKFLVLVAVLGTVLFSSCATTTPCGVLFTDVRLPMATGNVSEIASPKMGVSVSHSVLNLIATGDSSITTACANGNITRIHHVDWEASSFLGLYSTYKCVVWGE
ncbi:MAG: TRL-like family protein [Lentisphaeria bacterium]|nr:TRL-like family protein [Lentisphaeria bacterium]